MMQVIEPDETVHLRAKQYADTMELAHCDEDTSAYLRARLWSAWYAGFRNGLLCSVPVGGVH